MLSKSFLLWTTNSTFVLSIDPNAPSVFDDIEVIPEFGFINGLVVDSFNLLPLSIGEFGW